MFKKNFILFLLIFAFLPLKVLAYNNLTTHPALTSEMVKFYNNFSNQKITNQEKQWMMEGASEEDIPATRTLNHFYDPIHKTGLTGDINAGELAPFINVLKSMILSAKDWAQNSYDQATFLAEAYKNAALNPFAQATKSAIDILTTHTWEKAIYNYLKGNKEEAFRDLGHVLHLIEDMAVPAHTRNDHHLRGDAYESWTAQFGPNNIDVVSQLQGQSPLKFNSLDQCFNYIANYTNTHFYSQDTIGIQSGYNQPEWNYLDLENINGYEYSLNKDEFGEYFLLKKRGTASVFISLPQNITLNDDLIYSDYWLHLSRQDVLVGTGVINLFFQEVEKYRNDSNFATRVNKTILATTLENIKNFFGNLFGVDKNELSDTELNKLVNEINSVSSGEQFNEINLYSTPSPTKINTGKETSNEISLVSASVPTPVESIKPSSSPTLTPRPSFIPTPTITLKPSSSPTPSSTINSSSGGGSSSNSNKTINFCAHSTGNALNNKVIINEVAWMGTKNSSNDEWIELKNISNEAINLSNWQLIDKDSQIKISFPNKTLAPNEFYLLERTDDNSVPNISADLIFTGTINDTNEILQLFDSNCILQSEAKSNENGQWPAGDNKEKRSMERGENLSWHTYSGLENNSILGTPKQENSFDLLPSLSPSPSPSISPSASPSPTPIATSSKILISEFLYEGGKNDEGKEFIELYNPNNFAVDLAGWSLKIVKNNSTTSSLGKIDKTENHLIPANGFFLIGYNNFSSSTYNVESDISRLYSLPTPPTLDDFYSLQLLNKEDVLIDEIAYHKNDCLAGKSLERKANINSTIESMTIGNDQFLGNGYDSDSITDFIVRDPQPQNSFSLSEPRLDLPKPINVSVNFSTSSYNLDLSFSLNRLDQFLASSSGQFYSTSSLDFEILSSQFYDSFTDRNFLNSNFEKIEITKADWGNNHFEGVVDLTNVSTTNLYFAIRTKDKDGKPSALSEIIALDLMSGTIGGEPYITFYSNADNTNREIYFSVADDYAKNIYTYFFTSEESGYLKEVKCLVGSTISSLDVKAEIYLSNDNNEMKELLGESDFISMPSARDSDPSNVFWNFEKEEIPLIKGQNYAIKFEAKVINYFPTRFTSFYGSNGNLIMDIYGYKTYLKNLTQKTAITNPLLEEETLLDDNLIIFSAQIFGFDNRPVKLQVELKLRWESFDDFIEEGDPLFFESKYFSSGQNVEILVNNLTDGPYHWRARVVDLDGHLSHWYYYGDPYKYYYGQWNLQRNDENNSDFYVDVVQDYPTNTLYYQPLAENISDIPTVFFAQNGPEAKLFTFLAQQSGYVDSAEVLSAYGGCAFRMAAEIYSLSPDQNNGLPDQLLAVSNSNVSGFSSFDYYQESTWHFDREVYLEKGHYYALKIKFPDDLNRGDIYNCNVKFGMSRDYNNSRIYTYIGNGYKLDYDNDLRLIIYKKAEGVVEKNNDEFLVESDNPKNFEKEINSETIDLNVIPNNDQTKLDPPLENELKVDNDKVDNDNLENKIEEGKEIISDDNQIIENNSEKNLLLDINEKADEYNFLEQEEIENGTTESITDNKLN